MLVFVYNNQMKQIKKEVYVENSQKVYKLSSSLNISMISFYQRKMRGYMDEETESDIIRNYCTDDDY